MQTRKVRMSRFVQVSELLDHAFPKSPATPDHLLHHCEMAEGALLTATGKTAVTGDPALAELLGLTHEPSA